MMTRKTLVIKLKQLWAAHHYYFVSQDVDDIAEVVNVSVPKLQEWMNRPAWREALNFWEPSLKTPDIIPKTRCGDFRLAYQVWHQLFKNFNPEPCVRIPILSLEVK